MISRDKVSCYSWLGLGVRKLGVETRNGTKRVGVREVGSWGWGWG
jgi:hypothetical protein